MRPGPRRPGWLAAGGQATGHNYIRSGPGPRFHRCVPGHAGRDGWRQVVKRPDSTHRYTGGPGIRELDDHPVVGILQRRYRYRVGRGNVGSNSSGFFNLTSGSSGISGVQNFGELISGGAPNKSATAADTSSAPAASTPIVGTPQPHSPRRSRRTNPQQPPTPHRRPRPAPPSWARRSRIRRADPDRAHAGDGGRNRSAGRRNRVP